MVDIQQLLGAIHADAQALVVHAHVFHPAQHLHALGLQRGAMDPAGGLAQPRAGFARGALQQPDLACRGFRVWLGQPAG